MMYAIRRTEDGAWFGEPNLTTQEGWTFGEGKWRRCLWAHDSDPYSVMRALKLLSTCELVAVTEERPAGTDYSAGADSPAS